MPTTEFTPTVDELGRFLRSRTKTRFNQVVGTFTDQTPVSAEGAEELIAEAVSEVAIAVGSNLPAGPEGEERLYMDGAKSLVLLLAAMNVELQLMPEASSDPRSAYALMERRYTAFRKSLIEAVSEARGESGGGGESDMGGGDRIPAPAGTFPEPGTTMREPY